MAAIPVVSAPGKAVASLTASAQAATTTDTMENDGKTILLVFGDTSPTGTVTVASTPCSHGRSNEDITQVVAADTDYALGPFPPTQYNNAQGQIDVTLTVATDVSYLGLKL